MFPPCRYLTPLCTNLHQSILLTRNGPVGHEIRTSKTGAGLLLPRKHYVGRETQHAVEPNAPSASDEDYYAPDVPTNEL